MTPQPIDRDTPLAATLTAQEWNVVLSLLMAVEAPYNVTAPLISRLREQLVSDTNKGDTNQGSVGVGDTNRGSVGNG